MTRKEMLKNTKSVEELREMATVKDGRIKSSFIGFAYIEKLSETENITFDNLDDLAEMVSNTFNCQVGGGVYIETLAHFAEYYGLVA